MQRVNSRVGRAKQRGVAHLKVRKGQGSGGGLRLSNGGGCRV